MLDADDLFNLKKVIKDSITECLDERDKIECFYISLEASAKIQAMKELENEREMESNK